MLTGKAKEQFERWYMKYTGYVDPRFSDLMKKTELDKFRTYRLSMQWGVIQDFADSLNYDLQVYNESSCVNFYADIYKLGECLYSFEFKTRNEARTKAIEKLNEIINK